MMQWRMYFAKHLVKRKYIVDAEDLILCAVKSTDRFSAAPRSLSPPHHSVAAAVVAAVNVNPGHGLVRTLHGQVISCDPRVGRLFRHNDAPYVIEY
jgi:hypothetical protein